MRAFLAVSLLALAIPLLSQESPARISSEGNDRVIRLADPAREFHVPLRPGFSGHISGCKMQYWGVSLQGSIFDPEGDGERRLRLARGMAKGKAGMTLLGYAADGFPVYGEMAYKDPQDSKTPLVKMLPGYRLKQGLAAGSHAAQEYEYVDTIGDLDECNGRTGVTPEYPLGTYYYVLTESFPYVPRCWKGDPDDSFLKKAPKAAAHTTPEKAARHKPVKPDEIF